MTDTVTVSVPGKLILMGEHAVVYGHPALVTTLGARLRVRAETLTVDAVEIELPSLGSECSTDWPSITALATERRRRWEREHVEPRNEGPRDAAPEPHDRWGADELVRIALGETARELDVSTLPGIRLRIESEIPIGAGFGSSAATAVGVGASLSLLTGHGLDLPRLGRVAIEVERRQHGTPSGIDCEAVLHGGVLRFRRLASERDRFAPELECRPFASRPPLLDRLDVYDSGRPRETTGQVVGAVRRLREDRPALVDGIFDEISGATSVLEPQLLSEDPDLDAVRRSVRAAEAALEDLGVVPEPIRRRIDTLHSEGGAAKISGAGALSGESAGSLLVLAPPDESVPREGIPGSWKRLDVELGGPGIRVEETA